MTGSIIILGIAYFTISWTRAKTNKSLLEIGLAWLFLILVFEIGLGRFAFDYSWQRIGEDFNIFEGGLLPIGLLALAISPVIAAKLRGIK